MPSTFDPGDRRIPDCPAWLLERVRGTKPEERQRDHGLVAPDDPVDVERARRWLLESAPLAIEGAGGDHVTFTVAARIRESVSEYMALELMLEHWNERCSPPWEADELAVKVENAYRYAQKPEGAASAAIEFDDVSAEPIAQAAPDVENRETDTSWLEPEPLDDFDLDAIPKREWIVPKLFARTFVTALISPGGTGKTQYAISLALGIASGKEDLVGFPIKERTKVWLWNQEDDKDEMRRRIAAIRRHANLSTADTTIDGEPGFFYNSGVERPLIVAGRRSDGKIVQTKHVTAIIERIKALGIGLFIIDPLVEFHEAEENNNPEMAAVWRVARRISVEARCAVLVSAHTKKPPEAEADSFVGSMDALRGASAQGPVVRIAYTLFNMSSKHAKTYGVAEKDKHRYTRLDRAKGNIFLDDGEPVWFERQSVMLGPHDDEESVGILRPVRLGVRTERKLDLASAIAAAIARAGLEGETLKTSDVAEIMSEAENAVLGDEHNSARNVRKAVDFHGGLKRGECVILTDQGSLKIVKMGTTRPFSFRLEKQP